MPRGFGTSGEEYGDYDYVVEGSMVKDSAKTKIKARRPPADSAAPNVPETAGDFGSLLAG